VRNKDPPAAGLVRPARDVGWVVMLALDKKWAKVLISRPETGMGYQIVSVRLKDGRRFERVMIVGE